MALRVERIQLDRFQAVVFDQGTPSWAIVLPGAGYSVQAPLLWFARRAVMDEGRSVLAIADAFDRERHDPTRWVEERVEAALRHLRGPDPHPLLIAKSLTSLAAQIAAAERLPAVWLTPLIGERGTSVAPQVLAGLRAASEPALVIGGSDDPTWDGAAAATLPTAEVIELPGADHSLEVPADSRASLANLSLVTDAARRFAARLREPATPRAPNPADR